MAILKDINIDYTTIFPTYELGNKLVFNALNPPHFGKFTSTKYLW